MALAEGLVFADKQALFRAVVEQEAAAVASEIETAAAASAGAQEAFLRGGRAFLQAMTATGRSGGKRAVRRECVV